jgi:hypothetical protein
MSASDLIAEYSLYLDGLFVAAERRRMGSSGAAAPSIAAPGWVLAQMVAEPGSAAAPPGEPGCPGLSAFLEGLSRLTSHGQGRKPASKGGR